MDIQGEGGGGNLESNAYSNPGLTASTVSVNQRYSEAGLNDFMCKFIYKHFFRLNKFLNYWHLQIITLELAKNI